MKIKTVRISDFICIYSFIDSIKKDWWLAHLIDWFWFIFWDMPCSPGWPLAHQSSHPSLLSAGSEDHQKPPGRNHQRPPLLVAVSPPLLVRLEREKGVACSRHLPSIARPTFHPQHWEENKPPALQKMSSASWISQSRFKAVFQFNP